MNDPGSAAPLVLEVGDGREASRRQTLDPPGPHLVGRGDEAAVRVGDRRVSRSHAVLVHEDGGWWYLDRSSSGSFVGNDEVNRLSLERAVTIRLADPADGPALRVHIPGSSTPGADATDVVATDSGAADSGAGLAAGTEPTSSAAGIPTQIRIGRDPGNDVVVPDLTVSREHAVVDVAASRIADLGSQNGTFVAGRRVSQATLNDGDRITVGNADLVYSSGRLTRVLSRGPELNVRRLGYALPDGTALLDDVDLELAGGGLVAVIGPSGAGKSTFAKVLTGVYAPTSGRVTYDGFDVHRDMDVVRTRIGYVPQDDIVHGKLTAWQALTFAARLRLPEDTSDDEVAARVGSVLAELGLEAHAATRVDRLSGGQRKRVSTALELLTEPSLLVLDEPTSGLDPGLDQQIMASLRDIADTGRIVVVITHSPANLDMCDRVLLLAPGGLPAYLGPAPGLLRRWGSSSWSDVFNAVSEDPARVHAEYRTANPRMPVRQEQHSSVESRATPGRPRTVLLRQARTLVARHTRLIVADRPYASFLAALPVVLALLALVVPGDAGLRNPTVDAPSEPSQLLVVLIVGAAFMGAAVSAREVVGERAILGRELMAGLDPWAYIGAKLAVFAGVCAVQAALLVGTVSLVKAMPDGGAGILPAPAEIGVAVALTAYASCLLGLWASAVVRSGEQVMPVLVVTVMAQLVLCGGLIPVTGRAGLEAVSWLAPARWGYAAAASTSDLPRLVPDGPQDVLWSHAAGWWLLAIAMMLVLGGGFAVLAFRRVARTSASRR